MIVIPAIDMLDHKAVRLTKGEYSQVTVYNESILDQAGEWIAQGAKRLHLVDLNGAKSGIPAHFDDVQAIAKKYPGITLQVGGGIRDISTIEQYFGCGVTHVILGTSALKDPKLVRQACWGHSGHVILGIDVRDGFVATQGWTETSQVTIEQLIANFHGVTFESIVCTDISRDGMLSGLNLGLYRDLSKAGLNVIASGGLTSIDEIKSLKADAHAYGVIAGKAIYEKKFTLKDALAAAC